MAAQIFEETILNIDAVKDFQTCALLYDFRHQQEMPASITGRDLISVRFDNTMKRIAAFFFYKQQSGTIPSLIALVNRWERLWFPKDMTPYDMAVEQHESAHGNLASYCSVASNALTQFYEDFAENDAHPILIDEKFRVPVGTTVRFEGVFDLVLRDFNKDKYTVIKWVASKRRPSESSMLMEMASLKYALDYRNDNADLNVDYFMYDMGSANPGFVSVDIPQENVNAFLYWAQSIHGTDVFAPRRGLTSYCKSCPYDHPCSKFEYPEVKVHANVG